MTENVESTVDTLISHDRFLMHGESLHLTKAECVDVLMEMSRLTSDGSIEFTWEAANERLTALAKEKDDRWNQPVYRVPSNEAEV